MTTSVVPPALEPDRLIAGDTWRWTRTFADYPATDGWELAYVLSGPTKLDVTADADGSGFSITVSAAKTNVPEGVYAWIGRVSKDGEVYTVASGTVFVVANLATAQSGSKQKFAEELLPIVEAALLSRATASQLEYEIAGRKVKLWTPDDLMKLRGRLRTEISRMRSKGKSAQVRIRFGGR